MQLGDLKIAIVHYWLVRRRGGERVLEVLANMFPKADIFTLVLDPESLGPALQNRRIFTSFLQKIPGIKRHYKKFMPLFPLALEQFQLDGYDLVLSHEAGPAKGVLTRAQTCHICYVHSPMRYVWDMYHDYQSAAPFGRIGRGFYALTAHYLRIWDHDAASRVDYFIASSNNAALRIRKHYRRESDVIHPPVDLSEFSVGHVHEDFYLMVTPLVRYKRVDLAINACNRLGRRLVIIGDGELDSGLRKIAGPTVTFLGRQPDAVVQEHYRRCRAFIFPGEEDIGLTPIEAQASGRPVIAFGRGGALETVQGLQEQDAFQPGATGIFFQDQTPESLVNAIQRFEALEGQFSPAEARSNAERFDVAEFHIGFREAVERMLEDFRHQSLSEFPSRQTAGRLSRVVR